MENPKTIRVLKLVIMLCGGRSYSLKELMNLLTISDRTVYRDLETLEFAGFSIDRNNGRYHIDPSMQDKQAMRIFSEKPATIEDENFLYNLELGKVSEPHEKYNEYPDDNLDIILGYVRNIIEAIHSRLKVTLLQYRSSSGRNISNREVEPFAFSADTQSIWAYEPQSSMCKQFKITRLSGLKISNQKWKFETRHQLPFTDIFNLSAETPLDTIELELSLNAYNLMIEEFPKSKSFIKGENPFIITVPVAGYEGIGRFVMGLIDSVKVITSEPFKEFLKEKMQPFVSQKGKS